MDVELLMDCLRERGCGAEHLLMLALLDACEGVPDEVVRNHFLRVRDLSKYLRNYREPEIAAHLRLLNQVSHTDLVRVEVRALDDGETLEILVAGVDMTGVSACVTGYCAESQLSIMQLDLVAYDAVKTETVPSVTLNLDNRFVLVLHVRSEWPDQAVEPVELQQQLLAALEAGYWHLLRGDHRSARLESSQRDELVGAVLDERFRLERPLSQGSVGAIYLATQTDLGRAVAVKLLRPELSGQAGFVENFEREARLLAQVQSQYVVHVYAAGVHGDHCWMAMQYMAGGDVAHAMERGRGVTWTNAARWLHDALKGLAYLHREVGILHQDIKPSNLLLDASQNLKIADFGLSQLLRTGVQAEDGTIRGTPWYMAPEQARSERLDARSDLFSLGSSFYHILTGTPPFDASTPGEVLSKVARCDFVPLREVAPDVPAALGVLVTRLMQLDPDYRYQEAQVALADLESYGTAGNYRTTFPVPGSSITASPASAGGFAGTIDFHNAPFERVTT